MLTWCWWVLRWSGLPTTQKEPRYTPSVWQPGRIYQPTPADSVTLVTLPMADIDENAAMVNAIQRHATVIVQKSLEEGFGLTVAEGMWKAKAVVASNVGGISEQIAPGTGILLKDPTDLAAFGRALTELLADPRKLVELGSRAREHVLESFVGDMHLLLFAQLMAQLSAIDGVRWIGESRSQVPRGRRHVLVSTDPVADNEAVDR